MIFVEESVELCKLGEGSSPHTENIIHVSKLPQNRVARLVDQFDDVFFKPVEKNVRDEGGERIPHGELIRKLVCCMSEGTNKKNEEDEINRA